jgi:hypothetical protein
VTYFLNASQVAEACAEMGMAEHVTAIEAAVQCAAMAIAQKLNVEITSDASTEPGFAGLCVGFGPMSADQELPDALATYDDEDEWEDAREQLRTAAGEA